MVTTVTIKYKFICNVDDCFGLICKHNEQNYALIRKIINFYSISVLRLQKILRSSFFVASEHFSKKFGHSNKKNIPIVLLTHIHHQASWPTMQPLTQGNYTKAYYFPSQKPGKLKLASNRIHLVPFSKCQARRQGVDGIKFLPLETSMIFRGRF